MTDLTETRRSAVDFTDPVFKSSAESLGGQEMCAFLLAMAAWQRGLRVEFFGNQADARVNIPNMKKSYTKPRLFSVSDGRVSHFFEASMGDMTTNQIAASVRSKAKIKEGLVAAGVSTPRGLVSDGRDASKIARFLNTCEAEYFVVKPTEGSEGVDVVTQLTRAQVIPLLSLRGNSLNVVEEFVRGTEYRVYVVGDRAVSAYIRTGIFVVGNGYDSIGKLIVRKNERRQANPYVRNCSISLTESTIYLRKFGKEPSMVPVMGERVALLDVLNVSAGGDCVGLMAAMPADVASAAVAANRAFGLPSSGLDIIHDGKRPYVLELNDRAHIGGHAFPTSGESSGNAVAEAIIDHYFPARAGGAIERRNVPLDCTALVAEFERRGAKARFLLPPLQA
jgi:D-alanine-D-alanine ligase-like ATP-grasp enzyme